MSWFRRLFIFVIVTHALNATGSPAQIPPIPPSLSHSVQLFEQVWGWPSVCFVYLLIGLALASRSLVLIWGLTPLRDLDQGVFRRRGLRGDGNYLSAAFLIRFAKSRGKSLLPPSPPIFTNLLPWRWCVFPAYVRLLSVYVSLMPINECAQVLLAELCPLSVHHLLQPSSVLVCVGIKGGDDGY